MANDLLDNLQQNLTIATENLPMVTDKKMFGCYALWAKDNVFALVWKHGRIALKLPDEASFEALMATEGAEPWKAGPMKMAHWILVPESFHRKSADLKKWAALAHKQCSILVKKPKKSVANKKSPPTKSIHIKKKGK